MKITLSDRFMEILPNEYRYLFLYGGAGSSKSESAGRKIIYRCMKEGGHKVLILRKIRNSVHESVVPVIKDILEENEIPYDYNKTDRRLTFYNYVGQKNVILFDGLDNPEKIKSIKGITMIWMEELTEFGKKDFMQVDLRIRGLTEFYKQIMGTFNPDEAQAAWIKEMFFEDDSAYTGPGKREGSYLHHSTIEDNPILEIYDEYIKIVEAIDDPALRKIYREGRWAAVKGLIFPNWDTVPFPTYEDDEGKTQPRPAEWFDNIFYGVDFGYSSDPAAVIKIYRKARELWLQQIIYRIGLTNDDMADILIEDERVDINDFFFCDSAEPKSIEELWRRGINAKDALKGPDSVRAGIRYLQGCTVHILDDSPDIAEERKAYKWAEDKNGELTTKPVKYKDHAIDGTRYGVYTEAIEAGLSNFGIEVY